MASGNFHSVWLALILSLRGIGARLAIFHDKITFFSIGLPGWILYLKYKLETLISYVFFKREKENINCLKNKFLDILVSWLSLVTMQTRKCTHTRKKKFIQLKNWIWRLTDSLFFLIKFSIKMLYFYKFL